MRAAPRATPAVDRALTDDDERARREAADWFIRLREEPEDQAQRTRFDAWQRDPVHAAAWRSINETFAIMGTGQPVPVLDRLEVGSERRTPEDEAAGRRWGRRGLRAALVSFAAAACLALVIGSPALRLRLIADHVTGAGQSETIQLNDGSRIVLGPGSAITVAADRRGVRLLSGEAWFDVAHDPARPFRVQAGTVTATDIGTRFDVHRQGDSVAVTVGEGQVRVSDEGVPNGILRDLQAGDWVRVGVDHAVTSGTQAPELVGLWRLGQLQVRGATVAEAIEQIRPWYAGTILLTDPDLGRRRVTGAYDLHDPGVALDAIVSAYGGVVRRVTPWILVVSGH